MVAAQDAGTLSEQCPATRAPTPACLTRLQQADSASVLEVVERWLQARRYADARDALEELLRRDAGNSRIQQRLHEVRSLADEAAWLARRGSPSAPAADDDLVLAETRCTRLSGETALVACDQVLRARPQDARVAVARADLLMALGRPGDALAAYRQVADGNPDARAALAQKIAIAEAAARPVLPALDEQLAALTRARERQLISAAEFERQRASLLRAPANNDEPAMPALDARSFGRYHALVIGNDAYRHLDRLATAIKDARAIGQLLRSGYGFEVKVLTNATRADIVEVLDDYRGKLDAQDNLLIYYAGHGWLDTEADKGFWLPVDAHPDKRTQWVSNDTVRDALRALRAKHVLVVADSCFSGTLTRGAAMRTGRSRDYLERMARLKARQVLTSGGLEPVADTSGSGHSPFATALLQILQANRGVLDATSLFTELRRPVALNSDQVPQFADIRLAGHQGGDFLFVRRDTR